MSARKHRPYRRALRVWIGLMLLLAATTGSAWLPLGAWNSVVNLVIAAAKVLLVAVFFMHLRDAGGLVRLVACVALFMLVLLFSLAASDYLNRHIDPAPWQPPRQGSSSFGEPGQLSLNVPQTVEHGVEVIPEPAALADFDCA
ncbi:MAG: cytochrome C oxidase subunit IV family protein [Aromatoleum sp.]|jgi:cytochrome c oxidase subunit 4|uniref:cytochrome C oxidase subunit IV family protein n=1 Tax=Aromatoleum sp. TaxID=2307007 RepID=UPI0028943C51|nr:cytochrome C oxidase subunit IV family protein [Aromatoleum sp.]MDT3669160.1 cytochrome C oxidase subunit IV family protein [Aromatoleum sp.]